MLSSLTDRKVLEIFWLLKDIFSTADRISNDTKDYLVAIKKIVSCLTLKSEINQQISLKITALAFCDWSDVQKSRREMLRVYTFPRAFTVKFEKLETIIANHTSILLQRIAINEPQPIELKPYILQTCANIFTNHFCSMNFDVNEEDFKKMIRNFDEVFYEVNQGHAADFLPFLLPFHNNNLTRMNNLTEEIRGFILNRIVSKRYENYDGEEPEDYVESLISYVKNKEKPEIDWDTALFALEDIVGGHSAVGNFLVKLLAYIVNEPQVQARMQMEIDEITRVGDGYRNVNIYDKASMPYSESVIYEAIRLIASPIVPRVANQDCIVQGYKIKKGTMVFLNNYDLSMSNELWNEPEKFQPERFVIESRFVKPEHFLPFGGGRRGCMGYKMVQLITFAIVTNLIQSYDILPVRGECYKVPIGSLALPTENTYKFQLARRNK